MKLFIRITVSIFLLIFTSCDDDDSQEIEFKENEHGLFEGEIVLKKKSGLYETQITFFISDRIVHRQELYEDVIFFIPDVFSGVLIDLKKERITLYKNEGKTWMEKLANDEYDGIKSSMSFEEYNSYVEEYKFDSSDKASCYDYMFSYLEEYNELLQRKDVLPKLKLQLDFHLFNEGNTVQDVFASPKININKEILPLLFPNIPEDLDFPLISNVYTINGSTKEFDANSLSEDDIQAMINDGLEESLESKTRLSKIIERKITKQDVFIDLSNYYETDAVNLLEKKYYSGGGGFGFGDD